MKRLAKFALPIICLTFALHGCFFVVGAAAGAAAIAIVYDHRTIANTFKDQKIANNVINKIHLDPKIRNESHIEVTVFNRIVLLTGESPSLTLIREADKLARTTPEVTRVYNQIALKGPTSTLTRTSDSWITTKIKGEMLATSELKSSSIKVVTENGVVYLMGMVTRKQTELAVDVARQVSGVQKVVKIFQYTS